MDPSNGKASNFERRSSVRRSVRLSTATATGNGATEEDDYDLSAMMVADGFRPSDHAGPATFDSPLHLQYGNDRPSTPPNQAPQLPPLDLTPQHSSTSKPPLDQGTEMRNRPSSISKPPRSHDSLALRNEGTSASASGTHVARASSMSSDAPVMRVESPYRGPSGPSHPYQMYPQRTMSVATTSTTAAAAAAMIPEDRSYTGPTGPTHPYALYPQNTVPTGEPAGDPIPVGFNNMGGNYQRQLGPDGEEAGDMIGPLGHVEELPPYTRYPETSYVPKTSTGDDAAPTTAAAVATTVGATTAARDATTNSTSPTTEPTSPDRTIAGAGGIGMATRDPEFSSAEDDIGMPRARPSVRSNRSEVSHHDVNTAARDLAEKPTMNKWQRRAKKKLWGIVPYWAICLLTVGLILMGIIMGAVIGTLLTRHKKPPEANATATSTTAEVQTLTSVPTDLAPMATGHYGLPPFQTSQSPNTCFNNTQQSQAWSCQMPFSYYNMDVTPIQNPEKDYQAYQLVMNPNNRTRSEFIYGTQPPSITSPVKLSLVIDTYESQRGPAWWTTISYNKTVVVSESDFSAVSKRGWDDNDNHFQPPPQFKKKAVGAKEGDKPWICTWPNVDLEVFIYPKQNSSLAVSSTTTSAAAASTTSSYDDDAPPAYPKVLKMVELRYLKTKADIASCRQVEIINDGKDCRPVTDSSGNPIEVTIVENYPWKQKLYVSERYAQVPKRWFVRDLLARGASLELTDCGCLWWST